jgi:UDP-glucose 4-epimerase
VLGDGNQKKSYLNIKDCIEGMYIAMKYYKNKINIINLGTNEYSTVKDSIKIICKIMNLKPKIKYKGGKRGWVGDNPFIYLDTKKISATGWKPKYTIHNSIEITSNYLLKNEWLFKKK